MRIFRNNKTITIILLLNLFSYLFLFHSGIVLPFINPSIEEYMQYNSAPRDTNQIVLWYLLQIPFILYTLVYILKLFLMKKISKYNKL